MSSTRAISTTERVIAAPNPRTQPSPTSIHCGVSRIKMLMSHHGKSFTSTLQHCRRALPDYSTASPSPPSPFSLTGNTAHIATVPSLLPDANHPQCPAQHSCALVGANATAETTSAWYLSTKTRRHSNCPYAYKNKDELTPGWPPTVPRSRVRIRTPAPARPSTRRRISSYRRGSPPPRCRVGRGRRPRRPPTPARTDRAFQ